MGNPGETKQSTFANVGDLTLQLRKWHEGDAQAAGRIFPIVYNELRKLARRYLRGERPEHTLSPTALVHEAYLKLMGTEVEGQDRVQFFALAATVMRRILVDHAKSRVRLKRGGSDVRVPLEEVILAASQASRQVVQLDEALVRLEQLDPRVARIVELHYFGGLDYDEIAEALAASRSTVNRELRFAKAWLLKELAQ